MAAWAAVMAAEPVHTVVVDTEQVAGIPALVWEREACLVSAHQEP
jgi:hypothetical protein